MGADTYHTLYFAITATLLLLSAYLLNRFSDYGYDIVIDKKNTKQKQKTYLILSLVSFIFGSIFVLKQNNLYPLLIISICFGVLYSLKTIFKYPIKNYLVIKNIFAVFPKALVIIFGGILLGNIPTSLVITLAILFSCINVIYEILWDIRDVESDRTGEVRTIPNVFGKEVAVIICFTTLITDYVISLMVIGFSLYFLIGCSLVAILITGSYFTTTPRYFHSMVYLNIILFTLFITRAYIHVN